MNAVQTDMTVEQKLEVIRELLLDVSRAVVDLRVGVQRLYEKSREAELVDTKGMLSTRTTPGAG
jgi:hypothetical protein